MTESSVHNDFLLLQQRTLSRGQYSHLLGCIRYASTSEPAGGSSISV